MLFLSMASGGSPPPICPATTFTLYFGRRELYGEEFVHGREASRDQQLLSAVVRRCDSSWNESMRGGPKSEIDFLWRPTKMRPKQIDLLS